MKFLQFKTANGETVTFDEYTHDEEYNTMWVAICPRCRQAYGHLLGARIDDHGSGCCSVLGCNNPGDGEEDMRYVDFRIGVDDITEIE